MTIAPGVGSGLAPGDVARHVIEPDEFVADTAAFVDVRLPRSQGKASYSLIGPGVSQNADQTVNLTEPHGFNIGAASMPSGQINNPHLHFTAEVFVCTRGRWRMLIGEHGDQSIEIGPGDVFSAPTWVFRGFENIGPDDGWLFVVLGGDETGGILWAPSVLRDAAETGLFLGRDQTVIDTHAGDEAVDVLEPLTDDDLRHVRTVTDADLTAAVARYEDLDWNDRALLSHVVPGHATAVAPVLGHGLTEHRDHVAPITNPHGFSVEWLRVAPGEATGEHRLTDAQVLMLIDGDWGVDFNSADGRVETRPAQGSVVSVPRSVWRNFRNVGTTPATAVVVSGGDGPSRIEWSESTIRAAASAGWSRDASGYLAPASLVGGSS